MGWFQRTFGRSENAKLERANYYIARERYADAIREIDDLETSEAIELRAEATLELLEINLEEAKARFNAGDPVGAKEHIDIALHLGATKDQIKSVRRHVERVKQERIVEEQKKQKKVQESVDHGDDPIWSLPPDHPKLRYAFRVERYPLELQERLIDLGEEFASAVIQLEDGDPRIAYDRLSSFVSKDDVAYMERARAALQYGDLQRAASDLKEFGSRVGHCVIDNTHTGALLVSLISNLGHVEEALTLVEDMYRKEPHPALEHIRSQLLESHGDLRRAEKASAKLLKENPNNFS
jgi:tetratricopeptide (TPR) repeat protein